MATTKPRINVVLDSASYKEIEALAETRGCSLSEQVRSMVLDMLELLEDRALASAASSRRRTLRGKPALSHAEVWGRRAKAPR
ncbi:MAG TPA: antitoxin, RHH family protein [Planctomycetota bacterium]|nr:antitoxin, RHH family protein [Planctomycetota bacterium]